MADSIADVSLNWAVLAHHRRHEATRGGVDHLPAAMQLPPPGNPDLRVRALLPETVASKPEQSAFLVQAF